LTARTNETHSDIVPAGTVAVTSNPPYAAKPEYLTFIKELDALHNKLMLLLLPSTFQTHIIKDQPTPTTITTIADCNNDPSKLNSKTPQVNLLQPLNLNT